MRFAKRSALLTVALILGVLVVPADVLPAGATTLELSALVPIDGGSVSSSPDEPPPYGPHHVPYGGDYSFDVQSYGAKKPVYARFRNTNGSLSLSVASVGRACGSRVFAHGGNKVVLNVLINGSKVGTVTYAHLTNIPYSSGNVPVGARIGDLATAAHGVYSTGPNGCWTGPHVHVEPRNDVRYGCYVGGLFGARVGASTPLGSIGGERATGIRQRCPSNWETSGPTISEGSFVRYGGHIYRIAGGAPLYISVASWADVGGEQPATPLSTAQFNSLRRYPADGTFVSGNGKVFRFAGGAPYYVASWADVGGQRPATAVSLYTLDRPDRASPLNHVRRYPADGTFVSGNGKVFRFAGGAPIYVASWADVGGQRPATAVSLYTLDRPDRASPLNHVRRYPADGTFVSGMGRCSGLRGVHRSTSRAGPMWRTKACDRCEPLHA